MLDKVNSDCRMQLDSSRLRLYSSSVVAVEMFFSSLGLVESLARAELLWATCCPA